MRAPHKKNVCMRVRVYLYKEKTEMKLGPDGVFGPELENIVTQFNLKELRDEMELLEGAGYPVIDSSVEYR